MSGTDARVLIASIMGYTTIGCWLCAQLPQVVKNIKLRSCEGLALPFLVNWLFGDITNLIGCVLTDQLPFQTYLAAYFCLIDFALVYQFFYYRSVNPPLAHSQPPSQANTPYLTSTQSLHHSLILSPPLNEAQHPRTRSTSHPPYQAYPQLLPHTALPAPLSNIAHVGPHPYAEPAPAASRPKARRRLTSSVPNALLLEEGGQMINQSDLYRDRSYAAIYEAALDVARAAERAVQNRSRSRRRRQKLSRQSTNTQASDLPDTAEGEEGTGDDDADGGGGMMDSFHSDHTARSHLSTSTTTEHPHVDGRGTSGSVGNLLDVDAKGDRGRSMKRNLDVHIGVGAPDLTQSVILMRPDEADGGTGEVVMIHPKRRSISRSQSMARGSGGRGKGRRAAGVAFMSIGLLFRFAGGPILPGSSWTPTSHYQSPSTTGRVLAASTSPSQMAQWETTPRYPLTLLASPMYNPYTTMLEHPHDEPHDREPPPPSIDRIVGRISAWFCTTLYLTSRLPQIWKNTLDDQFNRKSVEGLSILLFMFAFLGNLSYVISILLNPSGQADPADAGHYLLEALPYLLGSGGTLMFDLTIIFQSFLYGSQKPIQEEIRHHPHYPYTRPSRRLRFPSNLSSRRHPSNTTMAHAEEGAGRRDISDSILSTERQPLLSPSLADPQAKLGLSAMGQTQHHSPEGKYGSTMSTVRERSLSPSVALRMSGLTQVDEESPEGRNGVKGAKPVSKGQKARDH